MRTKPLSLIALVLLVGCTSERDLGNVPDGGGDAGAGVAFAGSWAGVLTQSAAVCKPTGSLFGTGSSNVVMTLSAPSPTEVDIDNLTVCPVHGVPAGNTVHIQAVVCPTIDEGAAMRTIIYSDMGFLTLYNGITTTLDVHLYTSTDYIPVAGAGYYGCVAQLYGTLTKQ